MNAQPKPAPTATAPQSAPKPAFKAPSSMARLKALQGAAVDAGVQKDARSILMHASVYMDVHGWCYPSPTLLAKVSGYTEKSVRKALLDLRRNGLVLSLNTDQWPLAVDEHQKTPKHLPMLLLWPAATHAARYAALWAEGGERRRLPDSEFAREWYLKTPRENCGPFKTAVLGGHIAKIGATSRGAVDLIDWRVRPRDREEEGDLPISSHPTLGMYQPTAFGLIDV